jgi:hypothetical protein
VGAEGRVIDNLHLDVPFGEASLEDVDPEPGEAVGVGDDHHITFAPARQPDQLVESFARIVQPTPDILDGFKEAVARVRAVLREFVLLALQVPPALLAAGGDPGIGDRPEGACEGWGGGARGRVSSLELQDLSARVPTVPPGCAKRRQEEAGAVPASQSFRANSEILRRLGDRKE